MVNRLVSELLPLESELARISGIPDSELAQNRGSGVRVGSNSDSADSGPALKSQKAMIKSCKVNIQCLTVCR